MPGTAVQTPICDICGAEVRDGSLFCYKCGSSVGRKEVAVEAKPEALPIAQNGHTSEPANYDPATKRAERSERRKVRASNRQPVEIVWEPRSSVPWPFIVGSLVFVLIAFFVIFTAFYLH